MLNRSASLGTSTSILEALPGKPNIKRHLPSILYLSHMPKRCRRCTDTEVGKADIKMGKADSEVGKSDLDVGIADSKRV